MVLAGHQYQFRLTNQLRITTHADFAATKTTSFRTHRKTRYRYGERGGDCDG
jgi:hypothetical protein